MQPRHYRVISVQTSVIEKPPIFYAAVTAYAIHSQTKALGALSTDVDIAVLNPGDTPPFGLITTQTCNICEEARMPKQPWIQVVPVYAVDITALKPGQRRLIEKDRVGHLVALTSPTFASGLWVADLRLEVPLEKSVL